MDVLQLGLTHARQFVGQWHLAFVQLSALLALPSIQWQRDVGQFI